MAIFEIIVMECRAQNRKLLSPETQSHERLNGTFRFSPTKFVSVTVHVILQTYLLDNFSINGGKSVLYRVLSDQSCSETACLIGFCTFL